MLSSIRLAAKRAFKSLAFATPLHRVALDPYPFMFSPSELVFLTECITEAANIPGVFVEAGCAYGATTVFLNKFMNDHHIDRRYIAIDTFAGFTPAHIQYESQQRHKSRAVQRLLRSTFTDNKREWFLKTLKQHDVTRVTAIEGDVGKFDFSTLAPIAFCLLDVDLYLPIHDALPHLYDALSPGGMIIVDDCWEIDQWDGALQAYTEFVRAQRLPREIVHRKLGIIQR